MLQQIPGDVLRLAREQSSIKQGDLAKALDSNPTFVSRLEKGGPVEPAFAERYLNAVGTELANEIIEFYSRSWIFTDPPSFLHPDRENLWLVERTLQSIYEFEQSPQNHKILDPIIKAVKDDLGYSLRYLERVDHTIAWVGDIGVGKTTALAHAAGLLSSDGKGSVRSVFPVGSGRVTVCETVIKSAPAFGVAVEPLDEDQIRSLVRDMVSSVSGEKSSVSAEMARVLRNMSGYKTERIPTGDSFETKDPIADALKDEAPEIVIDKIVASMNLPLRRETSLAMSEETEDGMQWLGRTIAAINSGLDLRFSVPKRIIVLVPSKSLSEFGEISIVDTKGVETITQRPDLRGYIDDPRTLVVLCTKFPDAPNATVQRILRENEESGSDTASFYRTSILILARNDEPLQVLDQGEPVNDRAIGCAIRRDEVRNALTGAGLPSVEVQFYDAHFDKPKAIWGALQKQIASMRNVYVERIKRNAHDVDELITNVDLVKTRGARKSVEEDFDRLFDRIGTLPPVRRPAHHNLIVQFESVHQSSVAASMVRRGDWTNFSMLHILGIGVRQDAHLRSADHFARVKHILEDAEQRYGELADMRAMINSLRDRLSGWRQEFLVQAASIGSDAFKDVVANNTSLWRKCIQRYGTGVPGYKADLAKMWEEFFESSAPDASRAAVEARLADAWSSTVIEPLAEATRASAV